MKKMIVIESCDDCPFNGTCKAWKDLKPKERFTLRTGIGIGKFILKGCHLEDFNK